MILKQCRSQCNGFHSDHLAHSNVRRLNKGNNNHFLRLRRSCACRFYECRKTVTEAYYVEVLGKLRAELAKKYPGTLNRKILFHRDNAPTHF